MSESPDVITVLLVAGVLTVIVAIFFVASQQHEKPSAMTCIHGHDVIGQGFQCDEYVNIDLYKP